MTIKEFYQMMDVDSEGIIARFATEERVKKYLGKLLEDKTYQNLAEAMAREDYEQAFFASTYFKGHSGQFGSFAAVSSMQSVDRASARPAKTRDAAASKAAVWADKRDL